MNGLPQTEYSLFTPTIRLARTNPRVYYQAPNKLTFGQGVVFFRHGDHYVGHTGSPASLRRVISIIGNLEGYQEVQ